MKLPAFPSGPHGQIGFVGHRRLGHPDGVARALDRALAQLCEERGGHLPGLMCGFAEGADRLAVRAWRGRQGDVRYLFPCADPCYTVGQDLTHAWTDNPLTAGPECRIFLADHCIDAAAVTVIDPDPAKPGESPHVRLGAYMVAGIDALIAVWDRMPRPPDGSRDGGTAHVVEMARAAGKPVHIIGPDGGVIL